MILECLEPIVKVVARRCCTGNQRIEDLEQMARVRAWKILQNNLEVTESELCNMIERSFKTEISLDQSVHEEPEFSDFEKIEAIRGLLRKKYGRDYILRLKKLGNSVPATVVKGLIENVWQLKEEEIPGVSYEMFVKSGMSHFLWAFYRNSPMKAVQDAYPNRFFEWQFNRVRDGFWDGEQGLRNAVDAVRWLCQKYSYDGKGNLTIGEKEIRKEGLGVMLARQFNNSPFLAMQSVFPDLKPWQAKQITRGFYDNPGNQRLALDSLLLNLSIPSFANLTSEEIYDYNSRQIRKGHLENYGLRSLLARHGNSAYSCFRDVYPGKVHPWFFSGVKNHVAPREEAAQAFRWLFENYFKIPKQDIPAYATCELFWQVGFSRIMTRRDLKLNSSPYAAVNLAYPGEFSKSEFSQFREIARVSGLKDFRGKYRKKL